MTEEQLKRFQAAMEETAEENGIDTKKKVEELLIQQIASLSKKAKKDFAAFNAVMQLLPKQGQAQVVIKLLYSTMQLPIDPMVAYWLYQTIVDYHNQDVESSCTLDTLRKPVLN